VIVLRLGWRNLWRSPRRTALTVGTIAVAFAVLILLVGLVEGTARQMVRNGTRLLLGHLQLHDRVYLPDRGLHDTIGGVAGTDVAALLARIEAAPGVLAAAPRVFGFGLLSTGPRSAGARLVGVDPERERRVTSLLDAVVDGRGLEAAPPGSVLLGHELARELGAAVGGEVAVVTQAADGSMGNELWRVRGIVRTGLVGLDRTLALVALGDLQALLALEPARVHEVAAHLAAPEAAPAAAAALGRLGGLPAGVAAAPWQALAPELTDYLALLRGSNWMTILIIGTFAAFGVLNTMLMAVFERTRELGVLAAVGVRPRQMLAMVVAESACLAAVGLAAGLGLGAVGMAYLARHGIDLARLTEGVTVAGVLFDPVLRGAFDWNGTARVGITLAAITVLAGLVPALRAARMRPVEALSAPVE
jgi:ABC-type lipoprotein release transport system permease subunit